MGIPAAPQPYSVSLADDGEIYVTHLRPASSPAQSITNLQNYLVTLRRVGPRCRGAGVPEREAVATFPPDSAFSPIGRGGSNSIVITPDVPLRLRAGKAGHHRPRRAAPGRRPQLSKLTAYPLIQTVWASIDARGLAHPSQRPAAVPGRRQPAHPAGAGHRQLQRRRGLAPAFTLVRGVPLPAGPNDIQVIPRAGRAPLLVVSCAIDGSLAFYDDDLGQIAALVPGVGAVPFAIAVDRRGDVARLYVSNFGDGRIAVVDVPVPGGDGGDHPRPSNRRAHRVEAVLPAASPTTGTAWIPLREDPSSSSPSPSAVGLGVACSQTGNPPATQLSGTNAVVASGSLLFVTSTASNELRVLDLQPTNIQNPVDYVRAPNPLSPLSIPTLELADRPGHPHPLRPARTAPDR